MDNGEKLHDLLKQSVQLHSDHTALICNDKIISYIDYEEIDIAIRDKLKSNFISPIEVNINTTFYQLKLVSRTSLVVFSFHY